MSKDMPKANYNVLLNPVGDKVLLVQRNQAYEIDEVGAFLWNLCDGEHTIAQILESLTREYEVDRSQATNDINEFVADLMQKGLLQ